METSRNNKTSRIIGLILCVLIGSCFYLAHQIKSGNVTPAEFLPLKIRIEEMTAFREVSIQKKMGRLVVKGALPKPLFIDQMARVRELQKASGQVLFFPNLLKDVGAVNYEIRTGRDWGILTYPRPYGVTIPLQILTRFAAAAAPRPAALPPVILMKDARTGRPLDISLKTIARLSNTLGCGHPGSRQKEACETLGSFKRGKAVGGLLKPSQMYLGPITIMAINAGSVTMGQYNDVLFSGAKSIQVNFFPFKPQNPAQVQETQALLKTRQNKRKLPNGPHMDFLKSFTRVNAQVLSNTNGPSSLLIYQQRIGVYIRSTGNHLVLVAYDLGNPDAPHSYFIGTLY